MGMATSISSTIYATNLEASNVESPEANVESSKPNMESSEANVESSKPNVESSAVKVKIGNTLRFPLTRNNNIKHIP